MAATPVDVLRTGITRADRVLIVLAGPNGAGKSTFFDAFLAPTGIRFVNADLIARALAPDNPSAIAYEVTVGCALRTFSWPVNGARCAPYVAASR